MKQMRELIDRPLEWSQPSAMREEYELRDGDTLVATLQFRSLLGTFATARSGDGAWTFKRQGFFQTRATVRLLDGEEDLATFRDRTWGNGGTIETREGRVFRANTNFWMTKFAIATESGSVLVQFENIGGVLRHHAKMEVSSLYQMEDAPAWLPMLGWYLRLMMGKDSGAASAAAAAG